MAHPPGVLMPRIPRTLRRLARPALAVVLVFAQAVAAFGFPVVRSKAGAVKACGCAVTCGTTPDCCCKTPPPTPAPAPHCPLCVAEPEPPACPKCKAKEAPKPACAHRPPTTAKFDGGVTWVSAFKAKQCRGEGPAGLLAEIPAVPPVVPVADQSQPAPTAFALPADSGSPHFVTDPSDPPPRG